MKTYNQWLESLPKPHGTLKNYQKIAREALVSDSLPTNENEEWKFTNLKRVYNLFNLPIRLETIDVSNNKFLEKGLPVSTQAEYRVIVNSQKEIVNCTEPPQGISILSDQEIAELIGRENRLKNTKNNWLINLNEATTTQILGLKIDNTVNTSLELVIPSSKGEFSSTRVLIVVEPETKFQLTQIMLGTENSSHNHLIEINVGENSEVNHAFLSLGGGREANLLTHCCI